MKYKCVNSFTVDYYNEAGMVTEDRIEISRGSIWERDDETDIIGAGVHLDNTETMEWLEISEKDLEEYFELL
ncbi:hypothetical protein EAI28_24005 [Faecalicatena contorta]|uniref:Uncharacterized protein n=1 Tax=Faecalicatena contorta TaxID=39482 RepID=A0A174N8Q3_9FIRM|nr:hypothetical protein [Faecalicatena contorta]MRM91373.1 hypothetical protein [Faecalicatena contorta]CUP45094.1 Uncharacterised protein [[Eubacterium] contortum] [Faecalicatena contorta]